MSASDRIAIWAETGGDLSKDRTLFRFGKRVETVQIVNNSTSARLFDVQVARNPTFYLPLGAGGARTEITQETYFYAAVGANSTYSSPPFFADRGLKIKGQGANGRQCFANAALYGIEPGQITTKDVPS